MTIKLKFITCVLAVVFAFFTLAGCCCNYNQIVEQINQAIKTPAGNNSKTPGAKPTTAIETSDEYQKVNLDEIVENGLPSSKKIEVEGWPSYYDMVYTYSYYEDDPETITSVNDIYYPILSKEQYELYEKSLVDRKDDTGADLDIEKARELGLSFRVFVRHNVSNMDFVENPGEENWTVYKGIAKSGDEIDSDAMEVIKTGEIGPLLHSDLILILME